MAHYQQDQGGSFFDDERRWSQPPAMQTTNIGKAPKSVDGNSAYKTSAGRIEDYSSRHFSSAASQKLSTQWDFEDLQTNKKSDCGFRDGRGRGRSGGLVNPIEDCGSRNASLETDNNLTNMSFGRAFRRLGDDSITSDPALRWDSDKQRQSIMNVSNANVGLATTRGCEKNSNNFTESEPMKVGPDGERVGCYRRPVEEELKSRGTASLLDWHVVPQAGLDTVAYTHNRDHMQPAPTDYNSTHMGPRPVQILSADLLRYDSSWLRAATTGRPPVDVNIFPIDLPHTYALFPVAKVTDFQIFQDKLDAFCNSDSFRSAVESQLHHYRPRPGQLVLVHDVASDRWKRGQVLHVEDKVGFCGDDVVVLLVDVQKQVSFPPSRLLPVISNTMSQFIVDMPVYCCCARLDGIENWQFVGDRESLLNVLKIGDALKSSISCSLVRLANLGSSQVPVVQLISRKGDLLDLLRQGGQLKLAHKDSVVGVGSGQPRPMRSYFDDDIDQSLGISTVRSPPRPVSTIPQPVATKPSFKFPANDIRFAAPAHSIDRSVIYHEVRSVNLNMVDIKVPSTCPALASYVNDGPDRFFIIPQWARARLRQINQLLSRLQMPGNRGNSDGRLQWRPGDICAGFFENAWYRAVILDVKWQILHGQQSARVLLIFVDYGNETEVDAEYVRPLPSDADTSLLTEVPGLAIMCRLDGFDDKEMELIKHERGLMEVFLQAVVVEHVYMVDFVNCITIDDSSPSYPFTLYYYVRLVNSDVGRGQSVSCNELMRQAISQRTMTVPSTNPQPLMSSIEAGGEDGKANGRCSAASSGAASRSGDYSRSLLHPGKINVSANRRYPCRVTDVQWSKKSFTVVPLTNLDEIALINDRLCKFYGQRPSAIDEGQALKGWYAMLYQDTTWARVRVIHPCGDDRYFCDLLDLGKCLPLSRAELFYLPQNENMLKQPPLRINCYVVDERNLLSNADDVADRIVSLLQRHNFVVDVAFVERKPDGCSTKTAGYYVNVYVDGRDLIECLTDTGSVGDVGRKNGDTSGKGGIGSFGTQDQTTVGKKCSQQRADGSFNVCEQRGRHSSAAASNGSGSPDGRQSTNANALPNRNKNDRFSQSNGAFSSSMLASHDNNAPKAAPINRLPPARPSTVRCHSRDGADHFTHREAYSATDTQQNLSETCPRVNKDEQEFDRYGRRIKKEVTSATPAATAEPSKSVNNFNEHSASEKPGLTETVRPCESEQSKVVADSVISQPTLVMYNLEQFPCKRTVTCSYVGPSGSPRCFFLNVADLLQPFSEVMLELTEPCASGPGSVRRYQPGDLCMALFGSDWCRAVVLHAHANSYEVSFIDYGNSATVEAKHMRPGDISSAWGRVPGLAMLCQLEGISDELMALWNNNTDGILQTEFARFLVDDGSLYATEFIATNRRQTINNWDPFKFVYTVRLINSDTGINVNTEVAALLGRRLFAARSAVATDGAGPVDTSKPIPSVDYAGSTTAAQHFSKQSVSLVMNRLNSFPTTAKVLCSYVGPTGSPWRFFLTPIVHLQQLMKLMNQLTASCVPCAASNSFAVGDFCLAMFSNEWCRAVVIDQSGTQIPSAAKQYAVCFVDYGNSDVVAVSDMRLISDNDLFMSVPGVAMCCCLDGLSDSHRTAWQAASSGVLQTAFAALVKEIDSCYKVEFTGVQPLPGTKTNDPFTLIYSVRLTEVDSGRDVNVAMRELLSHHPGSNAQATDGLTASPNLNKASVAITKPVAAPTVVMYHVPSVPLTIRTACTFVGDGCSPVRFFLVAADQLKDFLDLMAELSIIAAQDSAPTQALAVGELCLALSSDEWCRAVVVDAPIGQGVAAQYNVCFIDYGNSDVVSASNVRSLRGKTEAMRVPGMAMLCRLEGLSGELMDEWGGENAEQLRSGFAELVKDDGTIYRAHVTEIERSNPGEPAEPFGTLYTVDLTDEESGVAVNAKMKELLLQSQRGHSVVHTSFGRGKGASSLMAGLRPTSGDASLSPHIKRFDTEDDF